MDKYTIAPPAGSTNNSVGAADRKWKEGHFEKLPGINEYLAESTGYGIVSGCEPSISGRTVTVGAGVVHLADGTRKEIASTNITLDSADSTNPRIDLVYIDSTGAVAKVTGTAAATPSVPALPSDGVNVAQVSVAAGATTGTLTAKRDILPRFYNTGIVNVKDFGAVGDGVHDDTQAIQAAIDYASENKSTVRLSGATYIVSSINIPSNIILEGNGQEASVLKTSINNGACLNILADAQNILIQNLGLVGEYQGDENGISFNATDNIRYKNMIISNVKISNFGGCGIYTGDGSFEAYNVNLINSYIYGCGVGVDFRFSDCTIDNVYIEKNHRDGIIIHGGNNKISNIKSIWNGIDDNTSWAIKLDNTQREQVTSIEAQDNYCNGILIYGTDIQCFDVLSDTNGYDPETTVPSTPYSTLIKVKGHRNTVYGKCAQYRGAFPAIAAIGIDSSEAADDCSISITAYSACRWADNINKNTEIIAPNEMNQYLNCFIPWNAMTQSHSTKTGVSMSYETLLICGYMQNKGGFVMALTSGSNTPGTTGFIATHIAGENVTSVLSYTRNNDGSITITSTNNWRAIVIASK